MLNEINAITTSSDSPKVGYWTVEQVASMVADRTINPNPIGQRNPVSSGTAKSEGIINSLHDKLGVGMLSVRDIRQDPVAKKVYPRNDYLVSDGGHRCRAIYKYLNKELEVNGQYFDQLSYEEQRAFKQLQIPVQYFVCSSEMAGTLFEALNKSTPINEIEGIMSNETSLNAKIIRSRTQYYYEYDNTVARIFSIEKNKAEDVPSFFSSAVNPRRKWDEYVAIAGLKAREKGQTGAGMPEIKKLVQNDAELSSQAQKRLDEFLDASYRVIVNRTGSTKKYTGDNFAAFMTVWFQLLERNENFRVKCFRRLSTEFFNAHAKLTGHKAEDEFIDGIIDMENGKLKTKKIPRKEYVKRAYKNFSNVHQQRAVADMYLDVMDLDICIQKREDVRTENKKSRTQMLIDQGMKCAIDGYPLSLEEAEFGHIEAYAQGGSGEGVMIRRFHNRVMGQMNLNDYKTVWDEKETVDQIAQLVANSDVFNPEYNASV